MIISTSLQPRIRWIFGLLACIVLIFIWYKDRFVTIRSSHTHNLSTSEILEILKRTGSKIKQLSNTTTRICEIKRFGEHESKKGAWGAHALCNIPPKNPCLFYSFGISTDYKFDVDLANIWKCQGVAFDPSIEHKSRLHPNITFHMIGAKTLSDEDDKQWLLVTTVPALMKCFKHKRINILKMDCEGCEFSLARDMENEMPDFFSYVDQVALEIHISKFWIKTSDHVMNLAKLFVFLENNNLQLIDVDLTPCASYHEDFGCPSVLLETGYPCTKNIMCQNLLFARV